MNIQYYRNFIIIIESGSLTAAAKKLNIPQPSLSVQLKKLEENFNVKLINLSRGIRKLELTDAGKIFYENAKYMCNLEDTTYEEINNFTNGTAGIVRISIAPGKATSFANNYLKTYYKNNPLISYELREVSVKDQIYNILNNISDFAITNAPLEEAKRFDILFSEKDELVILANKNNPWFPKESKKLSLKALKDIPISIAFGTDKLFEIACLSEGITPNIIMRCSSSTTALQIAALNLGIAIVPSGNYEFLNENIITKHIDSENIYINKILYKEKNKKLSPIVNNFIEFYIENNF